MSKKHPSVYNGIIGRLGPGSNMLCLTNGIKKGLKDQDSGALTDDDDSDCFSDEIVDNDNHLQKEQELSTRNNVRKTQRRMGTLMPKHGDGLVCITSH